MLSICYVNYQLKLVPSFSNIIKASWSFYLLCISYLLAGCSPPQQTAYIDIIYRSDPSGAILYINNSAKPFSYAPINYQIQAMRDKTATTLQRYCVILPEVKAQWPSLVVTEQPQQEYCWKGTNSQITIWLIRPKELPGKHYDMYQAMVFEQHCSLKRENSPSSLIESLPRSYLATDQCQLAPTN